MQVQLAVSFLVAGKRGSCLRRLSKLRDRGAKLDYVYVSHIDQDHISGVLQLLEDELEWRLFDHYKANGTLIRAPKVPRPPEIGGIRHNAFRDQVGDNSGDLRICLRRQRRRCSRHQCLNSSTLASDAADCGIDPEAIKVSRHASAELLDVPVNKLPRSREEPRLLAAMQKSGLDFEDSELARVLAHAMVRYRTPTGRLCTGSSSVPPIR
jgi:hypothetical protein